MNVKTTLETLSSLEKKLGNSNKLYYNRFGDGDVFIMMGRHIRNQINSTELNREMVESFNITDPLYLRGLAVNYKKEKYMSDGLFAPHSTDITMLNWMTQKFNNFSEQNFESAISLHYISIFHPDKMIKFLNEYIRPKKKMFVGSVPKYQMEKLVGKIDYYVEVPPKNAYDTIENWYPKILENIDDVQLFLPTCGMATRILNKRLWYLNKNIQSIDLGSIVDAVDSRQTRTWIRMKGNEIQKILL